MLFVVVVQFVQFYEIHTITAEYGTSSAPWASMQNRHGTAAARSSFSACLMFMDDNPILPEWLAYHYTKLPLRRLIVAVDPRSQTSPSEILQRWEGRMEITEWSDIDFMPPTLMDKHLNIHENNRDALTSLFRQRQEEFYTRCMARLKYEGRTWTAFIDTDEYILINQNAQQQYKIPSDNLSTFTTVLEGINRAQMENEFLAKKVLNSPCLAMARIGFGVKESTQDQVQKDVPYGFDGNDFSTMRWRWHAGRGKKRQNKISKSILDVSRVDSELFVPTDQVMVHIPSKTHCQGGQEEHLWILNSFSPIVVHHYAATWNIWSHRKDTRGRRTREGYEKLMFNRTTDDRIRPWLQQFVHQVGHWQARGLLKHAGKLSNVENP